METKRKRIEQLIREGYSNKIITERVPCSNDYVKNIRYLMKQNGEAVSRKDMIIGFLGSMSDKEAAERIGVKTNSITVFRSRHGIENKNPGKEAALQKEFTNGMKCRQYVKNAYGVIDVMDDEYIYELKTPLDLHACAFAIGQLALYRNSYPDRKHAIVTDDARIKSHIVSFLDTLGIKLIIFKKNVTPIP